MRSPILTRALIASSLFMVGNAVALTISTDVTTTQLETNNDITLTSTGSVNVDDNNAIALNINTAGTHTVTLNNNVDNSKTEVGTTTGGYGVNIIVAGASAAKGAAVIVDSGVSINTIDAAIRMVNPVASTAEDLLSVNNAGSMSTSGEFAPGILFQNSDGVTPSTGGMVSITNQSGASINTTGSAVYIPSATAGSNALSITNNGTMRSSTANGIEVGTAAVAAFSAGSISNAGTIATSASSGSGVVLANGTILSSLTNTGTISGGLGGEGIVLLGSSAISTLTNSAGGLITTADGAGYALDLDGAVSTAVVNNGTITGAVRLGAATNTLSLGANSVLTGALMGKSGAANTVSIDGTGVALNGTVDLNIGATNTFAVNQDFTTGGAIENASVALAANKVLTVNHVLGSSGSLTGITAGAGARLNMNASAFVGSGGTVTFTGTSVFAPDISSGTDTSNPFNNFSARISHDNILTSTAPIVAPVLSNSGYIGNGAQFAVISAGTLSGMSAPTVTQPGSAVLSFASSIASNNLILTATRVPLTTLVNTTDPQQGNRNAAVMVNLLELMGTTGVDGNDFGAIQGAIARSTSAQQVTDSLNRLYADVSGAGTRHIAHNNRLASDTAMNRLAKLRDGDVVNTGTYSAGEYDGNKALWMQAFSNFADQKNRKGIVGFDAETFGLGFGYDFSYDAKTRLGVGLSGATTKTTSNHSVPNRLHVRQYTGMVYGSYDYTKNVYVDGLLAHARNRFHSRRAVEISGVFSRTAKAEYDANGFVAQVGMGRNYQQGNWQVRPSANFEFSHLAVDSYTETDAGSANTTVASDNNNAAVLGLNLRTRYDHNVARGHIKPELRVGVNYDFVGDQQKVTSRFVLDGTPSSLEFISQGADVARSSIVLGAGLLAYADKHFTVAFNYDYTMKSDFSAHSGMFDFRYNW